jgi:Cu-Zn family superoxide dismutase
VNRIAWTATALTFVLVGCGSPETAEEAAATPPAAPATEAPAADAGATTRAIALLRTASGEPAGTATASPVDGQTMITLNVEGLPPGQHGVHVHMTGRCDPPTFESAGGHWNPAGAQHGLENPQGQHAGDMPNLTVGADGRGALEHRLEGTFDGLLDADGSAFVVHASADDQRTDPSGDSGDRIACGVFERS